jgi:hypothetical protein
MILSFSRAAGEPGGQTKRKDSLQENKFSSAVKNPSQKIIFYKKNSANSYGLFFFG